MPFCGKLLCKDSTTLVNFPKVCNTFIVSQNKTPFKLSLHEAFFFFEISNYQKLPLKNSCKENFSLISISNIYSINRYFYFFNNSSVFNLKITLHILRRAHTQNIALNRKGSNRGYNFYGNEASNVKFIISTW